jgi:hypothetical protein
MAARSPRSRASRRLETRSSRRDSQSSSSQRAGRRAWPMDLAACSSWMAYLPTRLRVPSRVRSTTGSAAPSPDPSAGSMAPRPDRQMALRRWLKRAPKLQRPAHRDSTNVSLPSAATIPAQGAPVDRPPTHPRTPVERLAALCVNPRHEILGPNASAAGQCSRRGRRSPHGRAGLYASCGRTSAQWPAVFVLGPQDLGVERRDELVLEPLAGDEHFVVARVPRGVETAVVAASLPAHERHGAAARTALEAAGQKVRRVRVHVASPLALLAPLALPAREDTVDLAPTLVCGAPVLVRDDPHLGPLLRDPLFLRPADLAHLAR